MPNYFIVNYRILLIDVAMKFCKNFKKFSKT